MADTLIVINTIFTILNFCILIFLFRDVLKLSNMAHQLNVLSEKLQKVMMDLQISRVEDHFNDLLEQEVKNTDSSKNIFRTADGKHSASSPEELIQKMANDPEYGYDQKEIERLKKFFDKLKKDVEKRPWEEPDDDEEDE